MQSYLIAGAFLAMVFAPAIVSLGTGKRKGRRAERIAERFGDKHALPVPPAARYRRSIAHGQAAGAVDVIHTAVPPPIQVPVPVVRPQAASPVPVPVSENVEVAAEFLLPKYAQSRPVIRNTPTPHLAAQPEEVAPQPEPRAKGRLQYGEPERMSAPRPQPRVQPRTAASPQPLPVQPQHAQQMPPPYPYAAMAMPYWQPPMPFAYPPPYQPYAQYGFWPQPPVAAPVPVPMQAACPHCAAQAEEEGSAPDFRRAVYDAASVAAQDRPHRSHMRR